MIKGTIHEEDRQTSETIRHLTTKEQKIYKAKVRRNTGEKKNIYDHSKTY